MRNVLWLSLLWPAAASAPAAAANAPGPSRLHRIPNSARHFLAGSISAACGVTLLAPVEIIRLNRMAGGVGGMRALQGGSWWRGNGFEVLAAAPRVGITMAAFSLYKRALLSGAFGGALELPRAAVFAAGACAGATATLFTHPLDVVRTRIAIEGASGLASCVQAVRAGAPPRGLRTCPALPPRMGVDLTRSPAGGPTFLYRGLGITLVGILPHSAVKLASYDLLRRRLNGGKDADTTSLPPATSAACGAIAGVRGWGGEGGGRGQSAGRNTGAASPETLLEQSYNRLRVAP